MISIIIPVLNNKQQLANCLDSILVASEPIGGVEIIIIDGGSSDGTINVINEYIRYISYWETGLDSGIADAFNRGISQATGEVVAILNSDDYWHRDTLKHVVNAYNKFPNTDVFYGDLQFLDTELDKSYIKKPDIKKMEYRMNIFHPAMFIKLSAYEQVGLYRTDFKYAMDSEWCHRALAKGLTFYYVPHVLATMRLGGVSDRKFKQSLQEYRRSIIQHSLAKAWQAWLYYDYLLVMKMLMRSPWLRAIKYKIQNGD